MMIAGGLEVDFIEELRLRRWARENYVSRGKRANDWHPVVHDEMQRKDRELVEADIPLTATVRC
jgi:hypothetical protein